MNTNLKRFLYWSPRVLGILFAVFISLFALDVFGEGYSFWETLLALLIHLIPTYIVIIAIIITWRRAQVGAVLFSALAIIFMLISRGEGWVIAGPLLLIGILFGANWLYKPQTRTL